MSHHRKISHAEEFSVPAEYVYRLLLDWGAIVNWMPNNFIQRMRLEGVGVGAVRYLTSGMGVQLAERLDSVDDANTTITLSLLPPLPWHLLSYRATGKVTPLSSSTCRLTWTGELEMPESGGQADKTAHLLKRSYENMFLGIRSEVGFWCI